MPVWLQHSLDWIGGVGDVGAIAAYAYGFYALWRARSGYLQRKRLMETMNVEGTVAISIGVGVEMEAAVRAHISKRHSGVPLAFSFHQAGVVPASDVAALVRRIRDDLRPTVSSGLVRRALMFYGGPYSVAMALGAIFDNWVPVEVYQYNSKNQEYEHTFTLDLETVKGIGPVCTTPRPSILDLLTILRRQRAAQTPSRTLPTPPLNLHRAVMTAAT